MASELDDIDALIVRSDPSVVTAVDDDQEIRDQVLEFYSLAEEPFTLNPDPRFMYHTEDRMEAFRKTRLNVIQRQGLSVICGDLGMGKSTVARRLYVEFKRASRRSFDPRIIKNAGAWGTPNQMIRALSEEFGVPSRRSESAQWKEFEAFAIQRFVEDKTDVVLIIDEAQAIPRKVLIRLREILNFETNTAKVIQVVLLGTLDLAGVLNSDETLRPLRSRVAGGISLLAPVERDDLAAAIKFRLAVAGRNSPLFAEECFEIIHLVSGGVFRDAMDICRFALSFAYEEEESTISLSSVKLAARAVLDASRLAVAQSGLGS
jgi:general secretion pathway protein A